jgi:hypothetical protein
MFEVKVFCNEFDKHWNMWQATDTDWELKPKQIQKQLQWSTAAGYMCMGGHLFVKLFGYRWRLEGKVVPKMAGRLKIEKG